MLVVILAIVAAMPTLAQESNFDACYDDGYCASAVCDQAAGTCQVTEEGNVFNMTMECDGGECFACDETGCLSLKSAGGTSPAPAAGNDSGDSGSAPATGNGGPAPAAGSGTMVADLGFRPAQDGFGFYNYGNEFGAVNLTPEDVHRMFGDAACANTANGCTLVPPAKAWMDNVNGYMDGGHCEGMAALSLLFYINQADENAFGSNRTASLNIQNNTALQREIAYWWTTQEAVWGKEVRGAPSEILDKLIESFNAGGNGETYTFGITKRDGTAGHAITPYAVEDLGDGRFNVLLYDNNFPNQEQVMVIDRNANTWQYETSINPSVAPDLYEGDASTQSLTLSPTSARLGQLPCLYCGGQSGEVLNSLGQNAEAAPEFVRVSIEGPVKLLITDEEGNQMGWKDRNTFVQDIPEASFISKRIQYEADWEHMPEFVYLIPANINFDIEVNGTWLEHGTASVLHLIGPGFNLWIDDLYLDPGRKDTIGFVGNPAKHQYELTYGTDYSSTPDIGIGVVTEDSSWEFHVQGANISPGDKFAIGLDHDEEIFYINTAGDEEWSEYAFHVVELHDEGEYLHGIDSVRLEANQDLYFSYIKPEDEAGEYFVEILDDETGELVNFEELEDKTDQFDEWYYAEPDPTGVIFTHESDSFSVGIPAGWATEETETGVLLTKENSTISAFHVPSEETLSEEGLVELEQELLALLTEGAEDMVINENSIKIEDNSYYVEFTETLEGSSMVGALLVGQDADTNDIYGITLLTDDIHEVGLDWHKALSSFTGNTQTAAGITYIHPHAFQMGVPFGWIYEDSLSGAIFTNHTVTSTLAVTDSVPSTINMIVPFYATADETLDVEVMATQGISTLQRFIGDVGSEVVIDPTDIVTSTHGFMASFTFTPVNHPAEEGVGVISMSQEDTHTEMIYGLIMLTTDPSNDDVTATWDEVAESFKPLGAGDKQE